VKRLLLLAALIAGPAQADALQEQVLAGMRRTSTADVPFTTTTRIERTGAAAKEIVTRHDPRAPAGRRWSVVRVDGRAPTAKEARDIAGQANRQPLPGYERLARWFGAPATRTGNTYRFARLPVGALKIGSHDASAHTAAEAVVNTAGPVPFVERVRFVSTRPFRMMLVAKVERYVFTATYAPLGDGRPFPVANDAEVAGAMMGKAGTLITRTRYAR
jgi:hypothetical protein